MTWIEQQINRLMRGQPAGFREVLVDALAEPESLPEAIEALEEVMLESEEDADLTIEVLEHLPLPPSDGWVSPLQTVMAWLEDADEPALPILVIRGGPTLLRIYDELVRQVDHLAEDPFAISNDVMAVLRVLTLYQVKGAFERLVSAGQHPVLQESYMWSTVFEVFDSVEHPWRTKVVAAVTDAWPEGYAQVAFLDLTNALSREGDLLEHPFDDERGHEALREFLVRHEDAIGGAARSAAAALAFLRSSGHEDLVELAASHPEVSVQIEATAVQAETGDPQAVARLKAWAADPRYAETVLAHLAEIGVINEGTLVSQEQDFQAAATMASWLAQPAEFNRPPDELTAVDTRELNWPPTEDRRRVWLFRYRYQPLASDDVAFEGLGMVGSVTCAMADYETEGLTVAEAYGLHCAWELEMLDDVRAPPFRDPKAGLRILREANPDL